MAATVVCFGQDDCNRSLVLRHVGYEVDRCLHLIDFRAVISENADADAVLVTEGPGTDRSQVVALTCEQSRARLVLFKNSYVQEDEAEFDLIIPPLMPPAEWLRQVAAIIDRSQTLSATARTIWEQSAILRIDSQIARLESIIERQRSAIARAKAQRVIDSLPKKPDSSETD